MLAIVVGAGAAANGRRGVDLALIGFGPLYVGLPAVALLALREDYGLAATLWVFASVWATDIGAYAFGRAIPSAASSIIRSSRPGARCPSRWCRRATTRCSRA